MGRASLCAAVALWAACTGSSSSPSSGGGNTPDQPGANTVAAVTASLRVNADDPALLDGPGASRLPLMMVRDLVFRVTLPQMPSSDATWVQMQVMNPRGVRVQERRYVFTSDPQMHEVTVPGEVPRPMMAVPAHPIAGGWALDFSIPVGGTNMVRRPMPGLWTFVVDVQGAHLEQMVELWAAQ